MALESLAARALLLKNLRRNPARLRLEATRLQELVAFPFKFSHGLRQARGFPVHGHSLAVLVSIGSILADPPQFAPHLIGFRVDRAGRLIAESTAPLAGLMTEELKLYLRLTAGTADRMELALTGKDAQ